MQPFQPSLADLQRRGIRFSVREHRINRKEDDFSDKQSVIVANAMANMEETKKRHAEWNALHALGKSPQEIADKYGVYASTVRRITGGSFRKRGRATRRIQVGGVVYYSQIDAMKKLHISREKLLMWLQTKRAKYV